MDFMSSSKGKMSEYCEVQSQAQSKDYFTDNFIVIENSILSKVLKIQEIEACFLYCWKALNEKDLRKVIL